MHKYKIESLNCMSCYHNIDDALKEYDSTIEAKADIKGKILTVESTHSAEQISKLIEDAGYKVSEIIKG